MRPHGAALVTGAGAAGALLTPGLGGGVGHLALGQSALRALTAVGQVVLDRRMKDDLVGLDAENGFGELNLADLLAGHVVKIRFRHKSDSPLFSGCGRKPSAGWYARKPSAG